MEPFPLRPTQRKQWSRAIVCALVFPLLESGQSFLWADRLGDSQAGEDRSGDFHYMSVCDYDLISRVALADVSGHGHDVSAVTQALRELMHQNINVWDQSDFMGGINNAQQEQEIRNGTSS